MPWGLNYCSFVMWLDILFKTQKTFLKPFHSFQFFFPEKIAFSFPNRLILSPRKMVPLLHLLPLANSSVLVLSRVHGAAVTNRDNDKHPSPSLGARGLLQGSALHKAWWSKHTLFPPMKERFHRLSQSQAPETISFPQNETVTTVKTSLHHDTSAARGISPSTQKLFPGSSNPLPLIPQVSSCLVTGVPSPLTLSRHHLCSISASELQLEAELG